MNIWQDISTFFSAENYNLFVISIGSGILCFAAGVVGTFTYLRKRALIGDVISHSVLPGVAIAFMTLPNLIGILLLRKDMKDTVKKYWEDFKDEDIKS